MSVSPPLDEAACRACLEVDCAAPWSTCQDNPACADTVDCVFTCGSGDTACATGCAGGDGTATSQALELLGCADMSCGDACAGLPL